MKGARWVIATAGVVNIFVRAITQDFDKKIAGVQNSVKGLTKGFADIAGAVYVAQQAFATASRVVSAFADEVKRLDDIGDLAARFNITTDAVQRLQRTFELSGGQAESLSRVMGKLQVNIGDANNGNSGVSKALERINLSGAQLASMSLDQSFEKIVRQIAKLPTPTERASVAMDLLGKSSVEIMEVFTRENVFEEAAKDVEEFGIKMNTAATEGIGKAAEEMERLGMAWESLKGTLTIEFAPAMTEVMQQIQEKIAKDREVFEAIFKWFASVQDIYGFMSRMDRDQPLGNKIDFGAQVARDHLARFEGMQMFPPDVTPIPASPPHRRFDAAGELPYMLSQWSGLLDSGLSSLAPGSIGVKGDGPSFKFLRNALSVDPFAPNARGATGGAAALEFGSTGAFSAIQQSKREDEMRKLQRQELQEAKKTNELLEDIKDAGALLFSLDLQG